MSSVNKVILVGRLGKDPELRYTPSGSPVARFSMATSESWTDKGGEKQERTQWHNIVAWNKLAEICNQYLVKGKLVYVEGRLETREYTDRDGNKRRITEIIAREMVMLDSRGAESKEGFAAHGQQDRSAPRAEGLPPEPGDLMTDEEIPF
jgi:single-strand DNA-binding protein